MSTEALFSELWKETKLCQNWNANFSKDCQIIWKKQFEAKNTICKNNKEPVKTCVHSKRQE
jgi:hypothetical protein